MIVQVYFNLSNDWEKENGRANQLACDFYFLTIPPPRAHVLARTSFSMQKYLAILARPV